MFARQIFRRFSSLHDLEKKLIRNPSFAESLEAISTLQQRLRTQQKNIVEAKVTCNRLDIALKQARKAAEETDAKVKLLLRESDSSSEVTVAKEKFNQAQIAFQQALSKEEEAKNKYEVEMIKLRKEEATLQRTQQLLQEYEAIAKQEKEKQQQAEKAERKQKILVAIALALAFVLVSRQKN